MSTKEELTHHEREWIREKEFWDDPCRADTYDLVHQGGYDSYYAMEKQERGYTTAGQWVKADDYRAEVERMKDRIKQLESK